MSNRHARGFTLIELAAVLLALGVIISILSPNYRPLVLRTRTVEARATVEGIANAEFAYRRDHGKYIACAPSSVAVPKGKPGTFDSARPGWTELGFKVDGVASYQYEVTLRDATFDVIARGDLNGDGVASEFKLAGDTLALSVKRELE